MSTALMTALAVGFALFSASLNAWSAVLQRRATGQVEPSDLFHGRLFKAVIRNKLWLAGIVLEVAGFFAQALALHNGGLVLVQPLLTTDIVFLLLILHFGSASVRIGWRAFTGAALIMIGLSALLVVAHPHGGTRTPDFLPWAVAFGVISLLIVSGATAMRTVKSIPIRAGIGGATAGLHFAFTAGFTKLTIAQLQFGFVHALFSWQLAGLVIVGVSSAFSMQSMYGAGPLSITQPSLEITEALTGIAIGILLFGDNVRGGPGPWAAEAAAGLVAAVGIIMLTGSPSLQKQSKQIN